MEELDISESRRLRGLGDNQRTAAARALRACIDGSAKPGVLLVIAGPSGTGKGTIVRRLLEREPALWFSVSATTVRRGPTRSTGATTVFMTPRRVPSACGTPAGSSSGSRSSATSRARPGRRSRSTSPPATTSSSRSTSRARWPSGRPSRRRCWCSCGPRPGRSSAARLLRARGRGPTSGDPSTAGARAHGSRPTEARRRGGRFDARRRQRRPGVGPWRGRCSPGGPSQGRAERHAR